MVDIFISYAKEDRAKAELFARAFGKFGWSIFWDRTIPAGRTWRDTVGKELADARCVVVLWSPNSLISDWVLDEADEAKRRHALIPVLIADVLPPIGSRGIQAANLSHWDGSDTGVVFGKLVTDIISHIGSPPKGETQPRATAAAADDQKQAQIGATDQTQKDEIDRSKPPSKKGRACEEASRYREDDLSAQPQDTISAIEGASNSLPVNGRHLGAPTPREENSKEHPSPFPMKKAAIVTSLLTGALVVALVVTIIPLPPSSIESDQPRINPQPKTVLTAPPLPKLLEAELPVPVEKMDTTPTEIDVQKDTPAQAKSPRVTKQEVDKCSLGTPDERVVACTSIIGRANLSPTDAAFAYDGRCWAYNLKGSFQDALRDCDQAITSRPSYAYAHNNRGVALENLGRTDEALRSYQKAAQLKPSFKLASDNLTRLQKLLHNQHTDSHKVH